jgi:hypothetical protein
VAGRTGPTGESYIGLTQAEADEQARATGLTTRVVGVDGMDLAATMDFRPDRLNLMLFDGIVVAAQLDGEEAAAGGTEPGGLECPPNASCGTAVAGPLPAGHGTLVIDLEPVDGAPPIKGVTVALELYDSRGELVAEPDWSQSVSGALVTTAPAGRLRLVSVTRSASAPEGLRCATPIEVPDRDSTRVTLLLAEDASGACGSVAAASFDADRLLGMPGGLPAPGFVGLSEEEAIEAAASRGWTIRVLARDGEGDARTDDYQPERVNLVIQDGRVTAAARS